MGMKAVVEPSGNSKYPSAKSVDRAETSDTLFFPHVDSCLAIVFILKSGAVIGAHAAQFGGTDFGTYQPNVNAKLAVTEMKKLQNGEEVLDVFTLGDGSYTRATFLADVTTSPVIVNADTEGGFDITVDPSLRIITAVSCVKSKRAEWKFSALSEGPTLI
jgi:hypothetical protein